MGYAYFEEPRGNGRVLWKLKPKGDRHTLELHASWGLPSDAALKEIQRKVIEFVKTDRPAPFRKAVS